MANMIVTIETENAAFDPDPAPELARILNKLACDLDNGGLWTTNGTHRVLDVNGNTCGSVVFS